MRKNGPKTVKKRRNLKGKVSENPGNMWVQPSKYGSSMRNLLQVGMIGAKYAMRPSGAGDKVSSQNNWHKQSKGENAVT